MSSSSLSTSPPPPSSLPASVQKLVDDLEQLRRAQRHQAVTRVVIGAVFAVLGVAIAWPVVVTLPPRLPATAALAVLAAVGVRAMYTAGCAWLRARYEVVCSDWRPWRWRLVRRWYAPGSVVWFADVPSCCAGPLVVLAWADDPACVSPWVLTYDGNLGSRADRTAADGGSRAGWSPVDWLSPTPVEPPPGRPHVCWRR